METCFFPVVSCTRKERRNTTLAAVRPTWSKPCALCVRPLETVRGVLFAHMEGQSMRAFAKAFYESPAWRRTRAYILKRDAGLCVRCGAPGVIVHHKRELTPQNIDDPMISLNADNLETLCRACHAIAHGAKPPLAEGLAFDEYGNVVEAGLMPKPAIDDDEFY